MPSEFGSRFSKPPRLDDFRTSRGIYKTQNHMKRYLVLILTFPLSVILFFGCGRRESQPPYKNPELSIEARVNDLLARMTLEEKIEQLSGTGFSTKENKRLGIPVLRMTDGPVGVRFAKAAAFPAAVAIAASWDTELTQKIGAAIAKETKANGYNYLLGPCVNIHRHPLGGRNFESYGEDPFLASRTTVAFIKGLQGEGVPASVKHFACNNQEWERHRVDILIDERALHEIYLPAFKAAVVEADVWTVMAAYNLLQGKHCTENKYLLTDILKKEWGFNGFVISDWEATNSTVEAANAGLDLEMPHGKFFNEKLLDAVKRGEVEESVIDDKVKRLMRVRFKAGLFDASREGSEPVEFREKHNQLTRNAAAGSIVLLKNKNNLLPLDKKRVRSIAVLGPNAAEARTGGGGSSKVNPFYDVSPLEGLQRAVGDEIKLNYAYGTAMKGDIQPLSPEYTVPSNLSQGGKGLWAEYFANDKLEGEPVLTRCDKRIAFNWGYDAPDPALYREDGKTLFSVRWTGKLLPPKTGTYRLRTLNNDGIRVYVEGKPVIDNWNRNRLKFNNGTIELKGGHAYDLRVEYFFDGGISTVSFGWDIPNEDSIAEAAALAKASDMVIIFAGLSARFESEGYDRPRLEMPNQDKLIEAAAAANPNTVVVLETGGPVLMNEWIGDVAAIIQAWYPGQEGGNAIADILVGNINPSGKLPVSFIKSYDDSPAFKDYKDKNLKSRYLEGIFIGYRYLDKHNIEPLFPFGHGLSYTTFEYSNLKIDNMQDGSFMVHADIENTGPRKGVEVVQVYVGDTACTVERPVKELKGFSRVMLAPAEKKTITVELNRDAFAFYDTGQKQWVVEPGEFVIMVGSSSRDIRLRGRVNL
jgi:beta-glucosidase